jgi:Uma2 family endonuclease
MSTVIDQPTTTEKPLYEVVRGVEVELASMGTFAGIVADKIYFLMELFLQRNPIGRAVRESLFRLDAEHDTRRRPDVAFLSAERWPLNRPIPSVGDWQVVPELAIEVVSPNDAYSEVMAKTKEYFHYGVKEVWLVDPTLQRANLYSSLDEVRIVGADKQIETSLLPGFSIRTADLFPSSN